MTLKAAFYILPSESMKERNLYTCRVIEKAFSNNHKIYIYAQNPEEVKNFDTQLWTFRDISFVPHETYDQNNPDVQILIGCDTPPASQNEILVNLTSEPPTFYKQFNHLIEVVPNDENLKALARKRFSVYQKQGYKAEAFNI